MLLKKNLRIGLRGLFILLIMPFWSFGQQLNSIRVVDASTGKGIVGVYITNTHSSAFVISKSKGRASLSDFSDKDTLLIYHTQYHSKKLFIGLLPSLHYVVTLQGKEQPLQGITVHAHRWEQDTRHFPYTVESLSNYDIINSSSITSADAIALAPGVFVQKSQLGGGSPMLRGFAANSVLIVVDDIRMNNAIFRGGNLQNIINISPFMVQKTEVIFGPGSVSYGSDALGGVMDFHLKKGQYNPDDKLKFNMEFLGGLQSNPASLNYNLDLNFGNRKFAARTLLSFRDIRNLKAGSKHYGPYPDFGKRFEYQDRTPSGEDTVLRNSDYTRLYPSFYSSFALEQDLRYKISNKSELSYTLVFSTTSNIPRYDRLVQRRADTTFRYAQWNYGPQKWMMHRLSYRNNDSSLYYDELRVNAAYQQFEESRHDRKFQSTTLRHRTEIVDAFNINMDLSKKLDSKSSLYYGIEANYNDVNSSAYSEDILTGARGEASTRYADDFNHYFVGGMYANIKYEYQPNITFLAGLRTSYYSLRSHFNNVSNSLPFNSITFHKISPNGSLGVAWIVNKEWQVNANIASGFRAPNVDDASKVFDSEPGRVTVPNEQLAPEYSYSAEVAGIYKPADHFKISVNLFYTFVDNIIVRRPFTFNGQDSILYDSSMSRVMAMQNAANGQIYGASLVLHWSATQHWTLHSDASWMHGTDNQGNSLQHVPPAFGSTTISYNRKRYSITFYSRYSGGIAFNRLAPEEQAKSSYYSPAGAQPWYTLNLQAAWQFNYGIRVFISVNNLLDRFYVPYASGIPAPGRNFSLSINIKY